MRSRKPFLIFWPQYFDAKKTRSEGRRLPQNLAIEKITVKDIGEAAKNLGYQFQIERMLQYPRTWWEEPGRVLINTNGKRKSKVLKEIAREIRKLRTKR
ncbi:MAG: signal recognition particle protein Srp19 [Candidatus Lokiarchaeota archaeon]|nr:signal recognition particle protein Srp19 [Candidatus Lokiarchaeota archaeon]MBD3200668.1 signal recognition particle protein Srp19 [Candidatus Lokiarchaeota archaeon]